MCVWKIDTIEHEMLFFLSNLTYRCKTRTSEKKMRRYKLRMDNEYTRAKRI